MQFGSSTGRAYFSSNQPQHPAAFWLAHNNRIRVSVQVNTDARGSSGQMVFGLPNDPPGTVYEAAVTFDMDAWARSGRAVPPPAVCGETVQS